MRLRVEMNSSYIRLTEGSTVSLLVRLRVEIRNNPITIRTGTSVSLLVRLRVEMKLVYLMVGRLLLSASS